MPGFIKTKRDEELWTKAKEVAEKAGHKEDWPYITGIWKKMKGKKASVRVAFRYLLRRATGADLTKDQEKKLLDLLAKGKGKPIPDDKIHALADEFKMSPHDLEAIIYGYASQWAISQQE